MSPQHLKVGFLGAGRMATALAKGLIASGFTSPASIFASDPLAAARDAFAAETGAGGVESNLDVLTHAEVVVLAVKPQQVKEVLSGLKSSWKPTHLLISIAAGVTIDKLQELAGEQTRIVRVMPNTPCLVGTGASAYSRSASATAADGSLVARLLETVGYAIEVPEKLLDAVTGLSGSGPAYVYQVIEALSDGGVMVGLPRDVATLLAAHTVLGAARMVLETGQQPAVLKEAVTSPGGTTIAGLHALETGGLRAAIMNAVQAATTRSQELGKSS